MKIIEKIKNKAEHLYEYRQPVIAFLGDSVTQGCFEVYVKEGEKVETVFKSDDSYAEKVKKIFSLLYPSANITIVNAGISGDRAANGSRRLKEDVLSFRPDLTVVCFGLNDSGGREAGIEEYRASLEKIFKALKAAGSEVVFMTPNLCCDRVDRSVSEPEIRNAAKRVCETVSLGWLDRYMESAKEIAYKENIPVCDCFALWKAMKEKGVDVNNLLSNKINHPTAELHWMFAYELVKTMFEN